jgi:hypothetical protein
MGVNMDAIQLPAFACFGAIILYVLNKLQGKQPFSLFRALNIDVSNDAPWHNVLLDMLLSSGVSRTWGKYFEGNLMKLQIVRDIV